MATDYVLFIHGVDTRSSNFASQLIGLIAKKDAILGPSSMNKFLSTGATSTTIGRQNCSKPIRTRQSGKTSGSEICVLKICSASQVMLPSI